MAVESPASTDLQAQRAELKAVLQSELFTRAPILANLLSYLCEKVFAGESSQIKEYSVGVEVFRRGSSFDQDSDSIVRVEMNRLRKRLAEYYSGPGASHHLRITIPVGQYVPEFEVASQIQKQEVPPPVASSETSQCPTEAPPRPETEVPGRWGKFLSQKRMIWGGVGLAIFLALGIGSVFILSHRHPQQSSTEAVAVAPNSTAGRESMFGLPMGEEIRILAGAGRSYVDHAGKLWNADAYYAGGTSVKSSVHHIWRTQDPSFYRTSRQGQFRYDIPLKKGLYELRLHFAETVYGPETTGSGGEGSRVITVRANGRPLLSHFDIVADAGASRTADVKVFPNIAPAQDGFLHLEFAGEAGNQATLSAIEILPGTKGHIRPVRILARQTPYYSNDSQWWSPDNYFEGGQISSHPEPVRGTDDPELFETERWGNFSYAIPVSPGHYTVNLYFAVHSGSLNESADPSSEDAGPVHIFNVFCNGKAILENFDLRAETHKGDVVIRSIPGLEPNAQGKLLLSFVPVKGYATVTGIEVLPQ